MPVFHDVRQFWGLGVRKIHIVTHDDPIFLLMHFTDDRNFLEDLTSSTAARYLPHAMATDPTQSPIVSPARSFDPIELGDATFPSEPRTVIKAPQRRFIIDRFKAMTASQAAEFLSGIDMQILESCRSPGAEPPFQIKLMTERLRLDSPGQITLANAKSFYQDYSPSDQIHWLECLIREEDTRKIVTEGIYDFVATQLPAIGYTLAHIFEGGYIGLLTARGNREQHSRQIQRINETLGFAPQLELIYYVNDAQLSQRLGPTGKMSAEKKALVLMNFINGLKEDVDGNWVPMSLGKPFDEIVFIDDEDKNLKVVMECLIRDVCSNVLFEIGSTHRTATIEQKITDRAARISEETFTTSRLKPLEDFGFWLRVVDDLLKEFTVRTGRFANRDELISSLMTQRKWLPDKLKVYDGNNIPFEKARARLEAVFQRNDPLVLGSKRSIVFNDIDGNLLSVPAKLFVHRISDPKATPLLELNQRQFAETPSVDWWRERVASEQQIPLNDLKFSWDYFSDPQLIEQDILRAAHQGNITKAEQFRRE